MVSIAFEMMKEEGRIKRFYTGLSSGIIRAIISGGI